MIQSADEKRKKTDHRTDREPDLACQVIAFPLIETADCKAYSVNGQHQRKDGQTADDPVSISSCQKRVEMQPARIASPPIPLIQDTTPLRECL